MNQYIYELLYSIPTINGLIPLLEILYTSSNVIKILFYIFKKYLNINDRLQKHLVQTIKHAMNFTISIIENNLFN